jgi:hypothetical protein
MRMQFSDGILARMVFEELSRNPDLSVNIFRGRTIPEDSTFELEVAGLSSTIKEFILSSSVRGGSIGTYNSGVA